MDLIRRLPYVSLCGVILAFSAATGLAQAPAEPPKPACTKPMEYPGNLASDRLKRSWLAEINAYLACIKKFAEDQNAIAQVHAKAASAAIEEYNATVKAANESVGPPK
jgi:hypothetical protein